MKSGLSIIIIFILLIGCNDGNSISEAELSKIFITTNQNSFVYNGSISPKVKLRNNSGFPIYFPMAEYVFFQHRENDQWKKEIAWFTKDGINRYMELIPNDSVGAELPFGYFDTLQFPGTYRFLFLIYEDKELTKPIPIAYRVSESFTVAK